MLVDITLTPDENLVKAEIDKSIKYLDLTHKLKATWHVASTVISIGVSVGSRWPKQR